MNAPWKRPPRNPEARAHRAVPEASAPGKGAEGANASRKRPSPMKGPGLVCHAKRRNAPTPKRPDAETPQRPNAETPQRRNAQTPQRRNAETPKRPAPRRVLPARSSGRLKLAATACWCRNRCSTRASADTPRSRACRRHRRCRSCARPDGSPAWPRSANGSHRSRRT